MHVQQQPCYILHARAWRETSLLLECLTRDHGRIGMVARGARKAGTRVSQSLLQPFQCLGVSFVLRGELATLRNAEPAPATATLKGPALLAALYANELIVRLTARQDPYPGLFADYARTLDRLAREPQAAWALRRFERDLFGHLGYALQLRCDADSGEPLLADVQYRYVPGHGPVRVTDGTVGGAGLVTGADLLALADDHMPGHDGMRRLRRLSRGLLLHHLGGVPLRSWRVLGGLPGAKPR